MSNTESSSANPSPPDGSNAPPPSMPELSATRRYQLGQRQLSRITLAVGVVVVIALGLAGFRVYKNFKSQRDIVIAKDNLLALYKAMRSYSADWDNHLPNSEEWTDKIAGYLSAPPGKPGGAASYLHGPGDNETVGYAFNEMASKQSLEPVTAEEEKTAIDPARTILLIEVPGAPPNAHVSILPQGSPQGDASLQKALVFPHYADDANEATAVILYANGHIETVKKKDFK